jgi:hypothetical protein
MVSLLSLAVLLQTAPPTVGDTIWVSQTVPVRSGYTVRASDWEPADPIELLGRARVVNAGDSAQISYPVVIWRPGQHVVDLPGPLLLGPGGTVDSLAGKQVTVAVRSVLPRVPADSVLTPQPPASIVDRQHTTPIPLLVLWGIALILLLPLHIWWRRRGKVASAAPVVLQPTALEPPLARWADAGESRAVASAAVARLRAAVVERAPLGMSGLDTDGLMIELARVRPDWPLADVERHLRALDDVRFGLTTPADALALARSTLELSHRLEPFAA